MFEREEKTHLNTHTRLRNERWRETESFQEDKMRIFFLRKKFIYEAEQAVESKKRTIFNWYIF